jgi:hypothetical protein
MTKVIRGTKKSQFLLHGRQAGSAVSDGFFFQGKLENTFESIDVDQIEGESSLTGDIDSLGAISFRKPKQLLRLAQPTPGELPFKQSGDETADGFTDLKSFFSIKIRVAHCVGRTIFRVIVIIR